MDDPNITMQEYIRLEEEKAQKRGNVFNWETVKYGKIWYDEDIHDLRSVETEFPAIAFNDGVSFETLSCEPTVNSLNDEIDFRVSFVDFDDEDYTIWLFHLVIRGTSTLGILRDRACLLAELGGSFLILEACWRCMSWREFIMALGLYTAEEMQTVGFGAYWAERARQIPDKEDLRDYWIGISSAPEKVTVTDLFYLRGMDIDLVNVPYLLARYLRMFAAGRKSGAHISGGQFVTRLAEHFGLLTTKILQGLTVIAPALLVIDMAELVRLQIYKQLDDTWAWVAMGPERQVDDAPGAPRVAQDAPVINEGGQADPAPVQAPPPPPATTRTMPQRMARLEEDMHEICGTLAEQRKVIGAMAHDFSRFCS
ncbi:hypothetical protein Tco_0767164 [Tanacetum coccineum]